MAKELFAALKVSEEGMSFETFAIWYHPKRYVGEGLCAAVFDPCALIDRVTDTATALVIGLLSLLQLRLRGREA